MLPTAPSSSVHSVSHFDTLLKPGDVTWCAGHLLRHCPQDLCGLFFAHLQRADNPLFVVCVAAALLVVCVAAAVTCESMVSDLADLAWFGYRQNDSATAPPSMT